MTKQHDSALPEPSTFIVPDAKHWALIVRVKHMGVTATAKPAERMSFLSEQASRSQARVVAAETTRFTTVKKRILKGLN